MKGSESDNARKFMAGWRTAGALLASLRQKDIQALDTVTGLLSLLPTFELAIRTRLKENSPELESSGLIEQQAYFSLNKSLPE